SPSVQTREEERHMGKTREDRGMAIDRPQVRWRNPVLRFEGTSSVGPEAVYDLLADLQSHLDWSGRRQAETTRLLTMDAPPCPATAGCCSGWRPSTCGEASTPCSPWRKRRPRRRVRRREGRRQSQGDQKSAE